MRYAVIFEKTETSYGAYVPDLPGCVAVGDSLAEAKTLISEAMKHHVEELQAGSGRVPDPSSVVAYIDA
jgi:predicted RNase H-like HicB family nuclease